MARRPQIEWEALEAKLVRLKKAELVEILGFAFDALPNTRVRHVFGGHVDLDVLAGKPRSISGERLLQEAQEFHRDSLKGEYYEGFNVNSKNFMEKSEGTELWIHEINRLFDQCVAAASKGHYQQVREAMDLLFDLLDRVDHGDDFVFFADEQGAWQVGVDCKKVLPAYFAALSATVKPDEYASRVREIVKTHDDYSEAQHLSSARKVCTPEQRRALRSRRT